MGQLILAPEFLGSDMPVHGAVPEMFHFPTFRFPMLRLFIFTGAAGTFEMGDMQGEGIGNIRQNLGSPKRA